MLVAPAAAQETTTNVSADANASIGSEVKINAHMDVISDLRNEGYQILSAEQTARGETQIYARNELHLRELVVADISGEILIDRIVETYGEIDTTVTSSISGSANANGSADAEMDAEREADADTEAEADANAEVNVEANADASSETEAETDSSETELDADASAETGIELGVDDDGVKLSTGLTGSVELGAKSE
jgi:hypothetical protein